MKVRDAEAVVAVTNAVLSSRDAPCRAAHDAARGVHLLACKSISAGELVASEAPLLLTPRVHARAFVCATCLRDSRETGPAPTNGLPKRWTRRCAGCRTLRFCSEKCEAVLSERHAGAECAILSAIAREELEAQEQLACAPSLLAQGIRLLADRHNGVLVDACPGMRVGFTDLTARLTMVADRSAEAASLVEEVVAVAQRVVPPAVAAPPEEISEMLSKIDVNQFATYSRKRLHDATRSTASTTTSPATDGGSRDAARACFVGVLPLFNHSCAPNVAFDCVPAEAGGDGEMPTFSIRSLVDIAADEELNIAYIDTCAPRAKRQEELRVHYGFECTCVRCVSDTVDDEVGGDWLAELRCTLPDCGSGYAVGEARRCLHCGRECGPRTGG